MPLNPASVRLNRNSSVWPKVSEPIVYSWPPRCVVWRLWLECPSTRLGSALVNFGIFHCQIRQNWPRRNCQKRWSCLPISGVWQWVRDLRETAASAGWCLYRIHYRRRFLLWRWWDYRCLRWPWLGWPSHGQRLIAWLVVHERWRFRHFPIKLIRDAVFLMRVAMALALKVGNFCIRMAAKPVTCGAAIEVPL